MHWKRWDDADRLGADGQASRSTLKVKLGDKIYSFGLGGLHSEDEPLVIEADETNAITDIDVSSYYPGLVVEERIAPEPPRRRHLLRRLRRPDGQRAWRRRRRSRRRSPRA